MAKETLPPDTLARNVFWLSVGGIGIYIAVVILFIL